MPKIDVAAVPARKGSSYPPPFDAPGAARTRRRLGEAGGLRDFGVNLMTLPPVTGPANATGTVTRTSSSMCSKAK
jgi:uncharacterized cupin superfamily protein